MGDIKIDYHPAPEWLTEAYLENILRNNKKDQQLRVINMIIKPATAKGDNYASIMTRVKVKYTYCNQKKTSQESYIVKTTYEKDPFISNIFNGYQVSQTEMLMYDKVLPQLTELLIKIGDTDKLFANTVYVDYEHCAIILEDLATSNYTMANRLAGMDEKVTKLALKKLAKMHATAAVLNEQQPGLLTKLKHGIFNRHTKGFAPFFENMIGVAANFAAECPELGNYYGDKLLKLRECVVEYSTRVYDSHVSHFQTLTHGDFWVNNVMLRFEGADSKAEQNVKDMIIIDFQFCAWSTPAVDLHYFFNTSIISDLLRNKQDALVQYYHSILVNTLKQLHFKGYIPTLSQLCVQLEVGRFMAVTSTLACRPLLTNDQTEDADFNAIMKNDERANKFRALLYANKKIQENAKYFLPIFDRRGLLDIQD